MNIIEIKDLTVTVGPAKILDDVSLFLPKGKIVGIVGGSGSGKTTLGLSILQLLPQAMRMNSGQIIFDNEHLETMTGDAIRKIRGLKIGMVFQEPLSAFDPLFTIGAQLEETLLAHTTLNLIQRTEKIIQTLKDVELEDTARIIKSYPHQLSGGLRQRAMIAQAIICDPSLIIADEPTSSLDGTTAAKIISLLKSLNQKQKMAMVLITHDLSVVENLADDIAVMTEGKIIEYGRTQDILTAPKQAYTKALIGAYA